MLQLPQTLPTLELLSDKMLLFLNKTREILSGVSEIGEDVVHVHLLI